MRRSSRLSVRYFDDRVLLAVDAAWAWFRLPTVTYEFLSDQEREGLATGVATALAGLADNDCHLLVVSREHQAHDWAARLDEQVGQPAPGWLAYLTQLQHHLGTLDFSSKEVYVGVRLGKRRSAHSGWGGLRRLEAAAGLLDEHISDKELDGWRRRSETAGRLLSAGSLAARHATVEELRWLVQRNFWRGIAETPPAASGSRPWGAGEIQGLAEGVLHNGHRGLEIVHGHGQAVVGWLTLARFPDELTFPGGEWLHHIDDLDFPVDVSLRMRIIPSREAAGDVRKKLAEVADQERHIADTGAEVPLTLLEQGESAKLLDYQLSKERTPLIYGWPRLAVAARSTEELAARVDLLVDHYRDIGIDVAWPSGDQLSLFLEAIPGDRLRVKAYEQKQSVVTVAGGMPTATSDLGDDTGPYIGESTGRRRAAVHFDPLAAARRNRPTVVALTGQPGMGKTFAAQLLTYQMALRGTWVLAIDPKGEMGRIASIPGLGPTRVLTLSGAEAGLLDPFALADDPDEGATLAHETLRLLLPPGLGFDREGALLTACRDVARAPQPSLRRVIDQLQRAEDDATRSLAPMLGAVADYPLAELCFASGEQERLIGDEHLTVVQIDGLTLPDPGVPRDEQGWPERLSVAVMFLLADFARRLTARRDSHQPKAIVLDEAYTFTGTSQGRRLVEQLARMGRSRNTAVVLVSQNARDFLDERVLNCVSAHFAFRSEADRELEAVLSLLGVTPAEHHRRMVANLRNGECIFRDLDGRVGTLAIDAVSDELRHAFDTTPMGVPT